jgi:hypothetical protein
MARPDVAAALARKLHGAIGSLGNQTAAAVAGLWPHLDRDRFVPAATEVISTANGQAASVVDRYALAMLIMATGDPSTAIEPADDRYEQSDRVFDILDGLVDDIENDDTSMIETYADAEVSRAAQARLSHFAGQDDGNTWVRSGGTCPICEPEDGQPVDPDQIALHPNCGCVAEPRADEPDTTDQPENET